MARTCPLPDATISAEDIPCQRAAMMHSGSDFTEATTDTDTAAGPDSSRMVVATSRS